MVPVVVLIVNALLAAGVAVSGVTASLKVAVMLAVRETPVAPAAGVRAVTVGRGPVVKVHVLAGMGLPPRSLIEEVRATVYFLSLASGTSGTSVAVPDDVL